MSVLGGSDPTARETHSGTTTEIDSAGDYVIDTTEALGGDVVFRLAAGRAFSIEIGGESVFEVASDGHRVRIDLGGGASERVVLGDALRSLLNEFFQTKYDVHVHTHPMGPTGPPLPPFTGTQMTDQELSNVTRTKQS
ncbi:MAG: hypothetical protein KC619_34965 [Myxococcales bacterium]|nr:hypothetical protein [Myxococcales bacterium]